MFEELVTSFALFAHVDSFLKYKSVKSKSKW